MTVEAYLAQVNGQKNIRGILRRLGSTLSVLVILGVFWGLKLTGITMAGEAFCGMEEHTHSEACQVREVICPLEETPGHVHTEECLERILVCTEEEVQGHIHSEACRQKVLTCTISDGAAHTHDDSCYVLTPGCGLEESEGHTHGEDCYGPVLQCDRKESKGHIHGEDCVETTLSCGKKETKGHTHGEDCYTRVPTCGLEESEDHQHTDACMEAVLTCERKEEKPHTHSDACYTVTQICEKKESEGHQHDDSCMGIGLICELPETQGHHHDDSCMVPTLVCEQAEGEAHVHGDGCYTEEIVCGLEEAEGHVHSDACYILGTAYVCGLEESEGHVHGEGCFRIVEPCPLEEHIHQASCYSDISADLETGDDWEDSLMGLIKSPSTAENIVMVAESQLGMAESTRNFQVDEAGVRRGITRYGQWYGNDYGDWSAMFACFCLEYAGVTDVPTNVGPEAMRLSWAEAGMYASAEDGEPTRGFLLFLDKDENGTADAVAVITDYDEEAGILFVIEGDLNMQVTQIGDVALPDDEKEAEASDEDEAAEVPAVPAGYTVKGFDTDRVARTLYALDDSAVMGYGEVPYESDLSVLARGDDIWLDGTNGGLMALADAANEHYTAQGNTFTLPTQWSGPSTYDYVLRGWYDVTNSVYYAPGATVTNVHDGMVFYADWVAKTYDVGKNNNQVADTVSTNDFVTVQMFDYNPLFNVMSSNASVTADGRTHTETWTLRTKNQSTAYNQKQGLGNSLYFIFRDWDATKDISYPDGIPDQSANTFDTTGEVRHHHGLYSEKLKNLLFDPANSFKVNANGTTSGTIGVNYLGTADHLFQLCTDPSKPYYGYYYYDSEHNAASYNQSDARFYVYNYLERTTDSGTSTDTAGKFSDFLPMNSPYANSNGDSPATYTYQGTENEYNGTTHYQYQAQVNNDHPVVSPVSTNFMFGMSISIDFYLPNAPGAKDGKGNQDIYGHDMHFRFSGDDDVWVLVDGVQVMDLGGIHGIEKGDVNFSTGIVTINDTPNAELTERLKSISAGEHTLTIYYLERGSSQSNCAIYFNLAPRFSFSIQKEDALTKDALNGAKFSVFTDAACETPAELWTSKAAHDRKEAPINTFTVEDGVARMWGLAAGSTYYIKETKPPDNEAYENLVINGIIKLILDNQGLPTYNVTVLPDTEAGAVSGGFTVHGFRIDEETQEAFLVVTNSPVTETTDVHARKEWNDNRDHADDSVTVYLTMTIRDENGEVVEVRRLQEVTLSEENNWMHEWTNLPKASANGQPVEYGIEEAYIPGYVGKITTDESCTVTSVKWSKVSTFESQGVYLLRVNRDGVSYCLATADPNATDTGFRWVTEDEAKDLPEAQWTAKVSGTGNSRTVQLTNGKGQILSCYDTWGNDGVTDFFVETNGETDNRKQNFRFTFSGSTVKLYYYNGSSSYYLGPNPPSQGSSKLNDTNVDGAMVITPLRKTTTTTKVEIPAGEPAFKVTNTPLAAEQQTALTVTKQWSYGSLNESDLHASARVTLALLANGKETGRTVTLTAPSWSDTFTGLPLTENGETIHYTVKEVKLWGVAKPGDWLASYGPVTESGGTYSTTVTNSYFDGVSGPELPATGTAARLMYILCGGSIMLASLVYGIIIRYKRRKEEDGGS